MFEEHFVQYDDGKRSIFYLAAGPKSGPLLIFVHGWPDMSLMWTEQLTHFASLGFRVVAPDLPGHGRSTANHVIEDYSQPQIVVGMKALLADTGRENAIWIAHDWGCGTVGTICATSPHLVRAAVFMAIPYRTIEMGLQAVMKHVNHDIYPKDKYPFGQWSYQVHYERDFDGITAFYDSEPEGFLKLCHRPMTAADLYRPSHTARVAEDGGPGGGPGKMPRVPAAKMITDSTLPGEKLAAYTAAFKKTGFYGTNALYMNHDRNREYNLKEAVKGAKLDFPVLFIEAKYDVVAGVHTSTIAEPQRELCSKLKEVTLETGHWVMLEKPKEVSQAIEKWLKDDVGEVRPRSKLA